MQLPFPPTLLSFKDTLQSPNLISMRRIVNLLSLCPVCICVCIQALSAQKSFTNKKLPASSTTSHYLPSPMPTQSMLWHSRHQLFIPIPDSPKNSIAYIHISIYSLNPLIPCPPSFSS
ncbi:uncharacterized protein BO72DRAFT_265898 [Aspergillus fijiensis CBS 313.89]|uniref:Uncharacterized protein n=1 Tax=Aspergillus fijiensis CBS 313.89 TaxID=1448319 RepID=A0A8G1RY30_9EURO|nr:uncharacterized protein BO72DRAFT_265898 [Aspergillus fijiensis CBS 313.89]RAK80984.1 hypothetical protein BO72DRAFT_265898 [Aspergillus fijiensis CBS 313.89]